MNKEQLLEAIDRLPTFEFRKVAVGDTTEVNAAVEDDAQWERDVHARAICEVGTRQPLAYVSPRYTMVQMAPLMRPIVEETPVLHGRLRYYQGRAVMDLYPAGDEFTTPDGSEVGVSVYNSVDTSSGLVIRFVMRDSHGREVALPKRLASYKKPHVGNIKQVTHDYLQFLDNAKGAWTAIVEKFSAYPIRRDEVPILCESFGVGEKVAKRVEARLWSANLNLWDMCQVVFDELASQKYTSDVHKRARMDEFCDALFTYKLVAELRA